MALSPAPDAILTVAAVTRRIRRALEEELGAVWVRGEVSGCTRSGNGHLYFALKDDGAPRAAGGAAPAVLDCVLFRTEAARLTFEPRDGMSVEAFGGIGVYEPRGRYQLQVRELRPAGIGALLVQFEQLKRRLGAEGLFDPARKRPLPRYPRRIGLVTSPVGAAVRDLVAVLRSRWPSIRLVLAPTRVQGPGAAEEIAAAVRRFDRLPGVELLIVGRGGGSFEDLWAFNEEAVVRAIAASRVPVISAVGHEVDWTLADLAADVRAATPSNAAEIAVRHHAEVEREIRHLARRARSAATRTLAERRRHLLGLIEKYGFRRQRDAVGYLRQRIDELADRLSGAARARLAIGRERLGRALSSYGLRAGPRLLDARRARSAHLGGRLAAAHRHLARARRARVEACADRLRALSPRRVLERGYCLARAADGTLVRAADQVAPGDRLALEFARGGADARIEAVRREGDRGGGA